MLIILSNDQISVRNGETRRRRSSSSKKKKKRWCPRIPTPFAYLQTITIIHAVKPHYSCSHVAVAGAAPACPAAKGREIKNRAVQGEENIIFS